VAVGAWAQTDDEYAIRLERVKASTEYLERYCLSGYEVSGDASVKAGISGLKKLLTDGLAGSLSAKGVARDARGAVGILEDNVKHKENASIRKCMKPYLDTVVNFLLVEQQVGDDGQCWDIDIKHPKQFPYYLKHSIAATEDFYWFSVDIDNRCSSTLYAGVTFKPVLPDRDLPAIEFLTSPDQISPKAGQHLYKTIDPRIRFLGKFEEPFLLKVHWSVKDDKESLLDWGSVNIQVLPRNEFVWGLLNAHGKPVAKKVLLASLAAWPQSHQKIVTDAARRALDTIKELLDASPSEVARAWMAAVLHELFGGKRGIMVLPTAKRFPSQDRSRAIHAPSEVLERGRSDPLEAALLIAAVSRDLLSESGIDQILVVAPDPERKGRQNVLLAWSESEKQDWSAIRAGVVGRTAFEDNLTAATAAFKHLLSSNARLAEGLQSLNAPYGDCSNVVVLDESGGVYALDFQRAKDCGIGALPF